jgi:hypothetical protein
LISAATISEAKASKVKRKTRERFIDLNLLSNWAKKKRDPDKNLRILWTPPDFLAIRKNYHSSFTPESQESGQGNAGWMPLRQQKI